MPLLMMCGLPCSGKSTIVKDLISYISTHHKEFECKVTGEESLGYSRATCFSSSLAEKESRNAIRDEVERWIDKDIVVIVDSPCYIKGYRYELYCIGKQYKSPQCVLHITTTIEQIFQWQENTSGSAECCNSQYPDGIIQEIAMRFETPNATCRWDRPLFSFNPFLAHAPLPFEEICNSLLFAAPPKPNQSTQSVPTSSSSFLYDLDQLTTHIVDCIMNSQASGGIALDNFPIENSSVKLSLSRVVQLPELRQARRQFISYCKQHPPTDHTHTRTDFIQFLNNMLK